MSIIKSGSQSVYGNYDRISRINYEGTRREKVVSINYVRDIDIVGNILYCIRSDSNLLIRSDLEVSYLDTLVTDVNALIFTMDTSLSMAFWTGKFGTSQSGCIMRAKLDNTDTREIVTGLGSGITGIALYYNADFNTAIEQNYNVPQAYKLFQNYPNPFNPVTTIRYDIPNRSDVSIKIYDITGRLVTTLIDAVKNAGQHSVTFRANMLSSGIYFYRLEAGSYSEVKRIMLLK